MESLLMLQGEARHCGDCGTTTVFLPVEEPAADSAWVCTACDAAVMLTPAASSASTAA